MKKIAQILLIACICFASSACEKNKNEEVKPDENAVVHGKVYGKEYTTVTGRATTDVSNNVERVIVNLSANSSFNCASPENSGYSVYFRVPKKVGVYTQGSNNIWLIFNDSASDQGVGFVSADCRIEISSISNGRVAGNASFADQESDSSVSGTFDVAFCQ